MPDDSNVVARRCSSNRRGWQRLALRLVFVSVVAPACESEQRDFTVAPDAGSTGLGGAGQGGYPGVSPNADDDADDGPGGGTGQGGSSGFGPDAAGGTDSEGTAGAPDADDDDDVTPAMGGADAGVVDGLLSPGERCEGSVECASGYCVDDVCCSTSCTEVCSACDTAGDEGTCAAAESDEACGELTCPPDTECRQYTLADPSNCADTGECVIDAACEAAVDAEAPCQNGAGTCAADGQCVVPDKLLLGEPCSESDECGSEHCVSAEDGTMRCCELACDGLCEACSVDGLCDAVAVDDSSCPVVDCPSDSSCSSYPDDLTEDRCAASGRCFSTATHCQPMHQASGVSCGSGLACDGQGNCGSLCSSSQLWCGSSCIDPNTDDSFCGATGDCAGSNNGEACQTGYGCESGVCLLQCPGSQVGCGGSCIDANTNNDYCGASGYCEGANAGDDCVGNEQCVDGTCRVPNGATCSANSDCITNTCTTFYRDLDGDGFGAQSSGMSHICGASPPSGYVADNSDCCDLADSDDASEANHNYTDGPRDYGVPGCAKPFDWDCDGVEAKATDNKACTSYLSEETCPGVTFNATPVPACGVETNASACGWTGTECVIARGALWIQACD